MGAQRAFGIGGERLLEFQFGDAEGNGVACLFLVETGGEGNRAVLGLGIGLGELQVVILEIYLRHLDQTDIAGDATVVPPVEDERGHILGAALVVDLNDDHVFALDEQVADIIVERCETTNMVTSSLTVYPDIAVVVDGTEVEQGAIIVHGNGLETLLKPDGAFVEEEALVARVPVGGNLHHVRLVEVVLDKILRALGFGVDKEAIAHGVHTIVVETFFLHVDDVVPVAVERHTLIGLHILKEGQGGLFG